MMQLKQAIQYAKEGNQSLHIHTIVFPDSPKCFRNAVARGEYIAHLFDQDKDRLIKTVKKYGVKVIKIEHEGTEKQHIDLCGKPLKRIIKLADDNWY